ncbi:MAG TPA: PQQ-dependent sugar dehydrogenase, partial [Pseudonocardiaceae bacterium]|nr:PQQ-dependent sugar dehydrogenase [Pseudonocardiaceae bacterium]
MPLLPVLLVLLGLVVGCSQGAPIRPGIPTQGPVTGSSAAPSGPPAASTIRVDVVAAGLEHVWDIGLLPGGSALITERSARIRLLSSTRPGARVTEVAAELGDVYVAGEGGLMGLVVHPDFAKTRRFTTCQTHQEASR